MKVCSKCKELKNLEMFGQHRRNKDGLNYQCKQCCNERTQMYYQNNKEVRKSYAKQRRHLARQSEAKWRANNKAKSNEACRRRVASKLEATPKWLSELDLFIFEEIYRQREDLSKSTGTLYHVDHIIPLKGKDVCGLHVPWNLQIITAKENLSKGTNYEK